MVLSFLAKKRVVVPLSVVTLTGLLSAFAGQVFPEPTDPGTLFVMDWVTIYRAQLDPMFARFADLWAYYVFAGIWYLFLAALVLQFGKRREAIASIIKLLTVFTVVYIAAYWIGALPILPMSFSVGMQMIIGSILIFAILSGFIVWKLGRLQRQVEFK